MDSYGRRGAWEIDANRSGEHRLLRTSVFTLRMRNYTDKSRRCSSEKTGCVVEKKNK